MFFFFSFKVFGKLVVVIFLGSGFELLSVGVAQVYLRREKSYSCCFTSILACSAFVSIWDLGYSKNVLGCGEKTLEAIHKARPHRIGCSG